MTSKALSLCPRAVRPQPMSMGAYINQPYRRNLALRLAQLLVTIALLPGCGLGAPPRSAPPPESGATPLAMTPKAAGDALAIVPSSSPTLELASPTSAPPVPASAPTRAPTPPTVVSAAPPRLARSSGLIVSAEEVVRGDPGRPWIALVINVGAGHEPATAMLDTLSAKQYRATFFVLGWWAERQPDLLRRIAGDGHEIASHGHSVFNLTQVSDTEVRADLEAADTVISAITGRSTRPLWSPSAGYRDARVRRIAADLGYRPIFWTLDSGDWTYEATAERIYERVVTGVVNGAIVVMHFDSPTTVRSTAVALPRLIDDLRAAGYRLVTITELITGEGEK